ncbi:MAG TPA: proteobacterial dedicated sortase system histidine kinase [Gammaproteobacteria bacterium]|nr:proteobacterial dedicated sortase system histidine kinase [Gammaproteobacteria bacterium]
MSTNRPRLHISIRLKLALVAMLLLLIPWMGYSYIQEMGDYLRQNREEILLARAETIAANLALKARLFDIRDTTHAPLQRSSHHLFVRPLASPIQLDGYLDDWRAYAARMRHYDEASGIFRQDEHTPSTLGFDHQVGRYGKYLYAVFHVRDDHVVYRHPNSQRLDQSDHLRITMLDETGKLRRYLLTTISPGWVNAHLVSEESGIPVAIKPEVRIKGEWQETSGGYVIEIRIPINMLGRRIAFAIGDVDDPASRRLVEQISTAGHHVAEEMATVIIPTPQIETFLAGFVRPDTRVWVVDRNARVMGIAGQLVADADDEPTDDQRSGFVTGLLRLLYQAVLEQPAFQFEDDLSSVSRLDGEEITGALSGVPQTGWRQTPDGRVHILTATHPVYSNGEVIGAVAIEETSNRILLAQNRAIEILFNLSLLTFALAIAVLFGFAVHLTSRIRRLRDDADAAISSDGRIEGSIAGFDSADELGDLSRSVSDMLDRISHYNRYLESMASKLTHEIRTPITVVKSSLDNLELHEDAPQAKTYIVRAREGLQRLNDILTRMSEATRLEQTLNDESREVFDLCAVVEGSTEGYRLAHPQRPFTLRVSAGACPLHVDGSPEMLAQLLDKLISNANDFAPTGEAIEIHIARRDHNALLTVSNPGPLLPEEMHGNLFDSMVSMRSGKTSDPHLGLGLYIVRLIAEFHRGGVSARNRDDRSGVEFVVQLPLAGDTPQ